MNAPQDGSEEGAVAAPDWPWLRSLSVRVPRGPPGSSLSCLEEEEGDARPTSVSLAPAGHPELSHVPLRARPPTRGGVVARARHVLPVGAVW